MNVYWTLLTFTPPLLHHHQPPRELNERLYWDTNSKQAVHFLSPDYVQCTHDSHQLNYDIEFDTASGELRFQFTAS